MNIVGIVCINKSNYSIGHNNQLLYALKNDMRFFKHTTTTTTDLDKQNAVLMGYNTYTSIPAQYFPLQNRINIIISNRHYKEIKQKIKVESLENVYVFRNILNGIHFCNVMNTIETLFVIGGSSIYDFFIKKYLFNNIYITEITKPIADIGTVYLDNIQILELNYIKHYIQTSTDNKCKCYVDNLRYTVTYSIYNYKS